MTIPKPHTTKKQATKAKPKQKTAPVAKPAQSAKQPEKDEDLYSLSYLADFFEMDRATLRKKLDEAKVKPVVNEPNRKLYKLEDVEAALQQENELDAVKLRKMQAEATLKEILVERETGDIVSRKEVEDYLQKLFTALYQRLAVRFPREIAPTLYKAESPAALTKDLQTNIETIFHEVRTDHRRFLNGD
jgi:hypothetical protein